MRDHSWSVVRKMIWDGDTEPSEGVTFMGDEEGARYWFERYAAAGEEVELRYQPPTVRPPERVVASTFGGDRCRINVWRSSRWAGPCALPKGHSGPHRAADELAEKRRGQA